MLNIKKLFAKSLPAIKTVSGTTDNNGNISLSLSKSGARAIISVDGSNYSYIPFVYQGNWYAKVVSSSPTHPAIINVHVDIEISYIRGGRYFVTLFMSTFSRLAEGWWEHVELKEAAYQNAGGHQLEGRPHFKVRASELYEVQSAKWILHGYISDSWRECAEYSGEYVDDTWNAAGKRSAINNDIWGLWNADIIQRRAADRCGRKNRTESQRRDSSLGSLGYVPCRLTDYAASGRGWACA